MSIISEYSNVLPVVEVNNIVVDYPVGQLMGSIHWVPVDTVAVFTANVDLPDGEFMTMIELVVGGDKAIKDIRRPATIVNGVVTLTVKFKETGNYVLSSERLNIGFANINAPFRLGDFKVEFDVYDLM